MPGVQLVDYGSSDSEFDDEIESPTVSVETIWHRIRQSKSDEPHVDEIVATVNGIVKAVVEYIDGLKPSVVPFIQDHRGFRDVIISDSDEEFESQSDFEVKAERQTTSDSDEDVPQIVSKSPHYVDKPKKPENPLGSLPLDSLPPLESLRISVPTEVRLMQLGRITSIFDQLIIIQSNFGVPAFDIDSVLFTKDRQSLGQVFEVFGPVTRPLYAVRFNSQEVIESYGLKLHDVVFCAPEVKELGHTVFTDALRRMKGTDASWENNQECPTDEIEFSDDEEERRYYAKLKQTNRAKTAQNSAGTNIGDGNKRRCFDSGSASNSIGNNRGRGRGRGRGNRGNRGRGGSQHQFSSPVIQQSMPPATNANWFGFNQQQFGRPVPMQMRYDPNYPVWSATPQFGSPAAFASSFPFGGQPPPPPPPPI